MTKHQQSSIAARNNKIFLAQENSNRPQCGSHQEGPPDRTSKGIRSDTKPSHRHHALDGTVSPSGSPECLSTDSAPPGSQLGTGSVSERVTTKAEQRLVLCFGHPMYPWQSLTARLFGDHLPRSTSSTRAASSSLWGWTCRRGRSLSPYSGIRFVRYDAFRPLRKQHRNGTRTTPFATSS